MEMLSRAEAEQRIRDRAVSDPDFRAQLTADPRLALAAELGFEIPEGVTVHVHEETVYDVHLALPPVTEDLSDADLELVSGGLCWAEPTSGINIP
jgi:hypothetical protein